MVPIEIEKVLRESGLSLEGGRGEILDRYVELLLEWNTRINLISRKDTENVWGGHILHSLSPLMMIEFPRQLRMVDLGTGGGLPGIPMAILHGGMEVTLLDSIGKKMKGVEAIVAELGLKGVDCVTGRAEEVGKKPPHRRGYDMVVARGVAPLADLIRWSRPFFRWDSVSPAALKGGAPQFRFPYLLAMKGGDLEGEIREARIKAGIGASAITVIDISFPGSALGAFEGKKLVIVEFS